MDRKISRYKNAEEAIFKYSSKQLKQKKKQMLLKAQQLKMLN